MVAGWFSEWLAGWLQDSYVNGWQDGFRMV
jgi:hypothetical protein